MPDYHIFRRPLEGGQRASGADHDAAVLAHARANDLPGGPYYAIEVGAVRTVTIERTTGHRIKPPPPAPAP